MQCGKVITLLLNGVVVADWIRLASTSVIIGLKVHRSELRDRLQAGRLDQGCSDTRAKHLKALRKRHSRLQLIGRPHTGAGGRLPSIPSIRWTVTSRLIAGIDAASRSKTSVCPAAAFHQYPDDLDYDLIGGDPGSKVMRRVSPRFE